MEFLKAMESPSTANFNARGAMMTRMRSSNASQKDITSMHLVQQSPSRQDRGTMCPITERVETRTRGSSSASMNRWATRLIEDERNSRISMGMSEPVRSSGSRMPCSKLRSDLGLTFFCRILIWIFYLL